MKVIRQTKDVVTLISLDELKERGNIVGTDRDNELSIALYRAIAQVEDISNVSLSAMTIKIIAENVTSQRLYYSPVLSITSVTDYDGVPISFETDIEYSQITFEEETNAIIIYQTTETSIVEKQVLRQCVLDLALAYFDGVDLAPILVTIPRQIC